MIIKVTFDHNRDMRVHSALSRINTRKRAQWVMKLTIAGFCFSQRTPYEQVIIEEGTSRENEDIKQLGTSLISTLTIHDVRLLTLLSNIKPIYRAETIRQLVYLGFMANDQIDKKPCLDLPSANNINAVNNSTESSVDPLDIFSSSFES